MLTSASGTFSLENVQEELYQNNKCNWLISVKQNHVISLALNNKTNGKCWKIEVHTNNRAYKVLNVCIIKSKAIIGF